MEKKARKLLEQMRMKSRPRSFPSGCVRPTIHPCSAPNDLHLRSGHSGEVLRHVDLAIRRNKDAYAFPGKRSQYVIPMTLAPHPAVYGRSCKILQIIELIFENLACVFMSRRRFDNAIQK